MSETIKQKPKKQQHFNHQMTPPPPPTKKGIQELYLSIIKTHFSTIKSIDINISFTQTHLKPSQFDSFLFLIMKEIYQAQLNPVFDWSKRNNNNNNKTIVKAHLN